MRRFILLCALLVMCSSAAFAQEDKITQGVVTTTTNTTYTTVTQTKQVRMSDEEWAEYKRQKKLKRQAYRDSIAVVNQARRDSMALVNAALRDANREKRHEAQQLRLDSISAKRRVQSQADSAKQAANIALRDANRAERRAVINGTADMATVQKYADQTKWGVGVRIGCTSLFNIVGNYKVTKQSSVELRCGLSIQGEATPSVDVTALYNWRLVNPGVRGCCFFDVGVGISAGGLGETSQVGAALMARFGVRFKSVPMTLSIDYTPSLGIVKYRYREDHECFVNELGLINFGITCTYNF